MNPIYENLKFSGEVLPEELSSLEHVLSLLTAKNNSKPIVDLEKNDAEADLEEQSSEKVEANVNSEEQSSEEVESLKKDDSSKQTALEKAVQVFLLEVGDSLEGMFLEVGNKFISKVKRECSGILLSINGDNNFLQGTQLQEAVALSSCRAGDRIRVTKIMQYKRAANRAHARAAQFKIEVLK